MPGRNMPFGKCGEFWALQLVHVLEEVIEQRRDGSGVAEKLTQSSNGRFEVRAVEARS